MRFGSGVAMLAAALIALALPAGAEDKAGEAALLQAGTAAAARGDEASAFAIFRRLAIADQPEAQRRLGLLLEAAQGAGPRDWAAAAYWYGRAAGQGDGPAMLRLAALWADGRVGSFRELGRTAPWLGEAVRWLAAAVKAGVPEARPALDALAQRSPLAATLAARAAGDLAAARAQLAPLAAGRSLEAAYWLGVMSEAGEGGPADPAAAIRWYQQAANLGEPHAALALGRIYETGAGVPADRDRAFHAYSAARARNLAGAAAAIGRLDLARRGVALPPGLPGALLAAQDGEPALGIALLRPIAEQGDSEAQYWLAALQDSESREEAIRWYRAAALQGDSESAYQLAQLLAPGRAMDGRGRSLGDATEMVRWLTQAAEAGHQDAATALAAAYNDGTGVARDAAAAERWTRRANEMAAAAPALTRPACVEDPAAPALLPAFLACNRGDSGGLAAALLPLAAAGDARAEAWVGYLLTGAAGGGGFDLMMRPNMQRAAAWYAKAAAQGLPSAMYDYSVLLAAGAGLPADAAAAKQWAEKASAAGFKPPQ
jgi:TPR repeat protein